MLFITSVFASTATITVSAARLRKEANTESDVLTKIYEGEKVEMLSKIKDALPEAEYFQICKFLHVAKKKREL